MVVNIGDVIDGALVNAIALMGRRVSTVVGAWHNRGTANDLAIARWFETYHFTREVPDLPRLSPAVAELLAKVLRGDETQSALQELLAARLTDAPETDVAKSRHVLSSTLSTADPDASQFADALAEYYDDQICALVARLESQDPRLLVQIRSEAFSTRMINILNAIERHTAALATRPERHTEKDYLSRYRRHVIDQHGKLEPPDFDRRRRVPIAKIFVPTAIFKDFHNAPAPRLTSQSLNVYSLAEELDRTVLLGDPGSGKTTTANVLMHDFALNPAGRVPFLVTLRTYAEKNLPERSISNYIEYVLETFYQCAPPRGLVNLLLLSGRAVVIFDGLDELLDTSHRREVTNRVERFCAEYPLCPVLVTSRLIGYDQARLDDRQFTCYRLGGFGEEEVAAYVNKWFAGADDAAPGDGEAFLNESDNVPDLRSNPLMLALLCILYRGEGSLPRNRAEVYEQCAIMLFRKWDARRRIHHQLRAGHLLEPLLHHLAWRLYTSDDPRSAVTEFDLLAATAEFLHQIEFESEHDARDAAREFVEFSHGRMWVFSDAGTTATGEKLYAFTHRTFLEYFAAARLAYHSDSPEQLAKNLAPRIARNEWWAIAELAIQIKHRTSSRGAARIYTALIADDSLRRTLPRPDVLRFLALCLRSVDLPAKSVRELTRQLLDEAFAAERPQETADGLTGVTGHNMFGGTSRWQLAVRQLLTGCGSYRDTVADEVDAVISDKALSANQVGFVNAVRFALSLSRVVRSSDHVFGDRERAFWKSREDANIQRHAATVLAVAETDVYVRLVALRCGYIRVTQALNLPGGLNALCRETTNFFNDNNGSYLGPVFNALSYGWPAFGVSSAVRDLQAIGKYLMDREPPWFHESSMPRLFQTENLKPENFGKVSQMNFIAFLGAAAMLSGLTERDKRLLHTSQELGPLQSLWPYLQRRSNANLPIALPELPVPDEFRQKFRDWAERKLDFVVEDWESL